MTNRRLQLIIREQDPLTLAPNSSIQHACRRMWERRVGAVLVVEGGRLVGIFTGRDAVHAIADGREPCDTPLGDAMTANPDTIASTASAIDALRKMRDCGYRHLPVVDADKIIGIVSRGDFAGLELDRIEEETALWERTA